MMNQLHPVATQIREARPADMAAILAIFREAVESGDAYAFAPGTHQAILQAYWFAPNAQVYVACLTDGTIAGTYTLRPNQPGLGAHVANGAFAVGSAWRGRGIGKGLGEHALVTAAAVGYRAMQFNFVASTNVGAVRLWQQLGFAIAGTLPEAFRHPHQGLVDAYIMYRPLSSPSTTDDLENANTTA